MSQEQKLRHDGNFVWEGDLEHVGSLLIRIRESRRISQEQLIAESGLPRTTVWRIEQNRCEANLANVERYIDGLGALANLTSKQRDRLVEAWRYSRVERKHRIEEEIAEIDLNDIKRSHEIPMLHELHSLLKHEKRPAFIRDDLWFVHAFNGATLRMFDVDFAIKENLQAWQTWHVIGSKFVSDSPIRLAHDKPGDYFRNAIEYFWRDLHNRYLFAAQTRYLIYRLHESSNNLLEFEWYWQQASELKLRYSLDHFTRQLYSPYDKTRKFKAECNAPRATEEVEASIVPELLAHTVSYSLVVWNPVDEAATEIFGKIAREEDSQRIFYAADYETPDNPIHVNNWPVLQV